LAFIFHSITIEKQTGHVFDACTCITNTVSLWDREIETFALIHSSFPLLLSDDEEEAII